MTQADFIAACFWPITIIFCVLWLRVRRPGQSGPLLMATCGIAAVYFLLWLVYGRSSLIAILDWYLFVGVLGGFMLWSGCTNIRTASDRKSRVLLLATALLGLAMLAFGPTIIYRDLFQPRLVVEGRVDSVGTSGSRNREYIANIAGRTVKTTTPIHERLKFLPLVRAEVGRGSNYVYKIDYLAN